MSAYQTILASPEMTSSYVAAVVITGLVVVFACLIILVLFLYLMGFIFNRDKKTKKKDNIAVSGSSAAKGQNTADSVGKTSTVKSGISNEVVAAISAAIAMIGEKAGKKLLVKRITRSSKRGVNSWAQAGKIDNTRPF